MKVFIIFFYRRYLRETLKIANAEESYRLAACSLILLGHTFLKGGNIQVRYVLSMINLVFMIEYDRVHVKNRNVSQAFSFTILPFSFIINSPWRAFQEALDVVKSGVQMADKMPDAYIQLWGASLLRGRFCAFGNRDSVIGLFNLVALCICESLLPTSTFTQICFIYSEQKSATVRFSSENHQRCRKIDSLFGGGGGRGLCTCYK